MLQLQSLNVVSKIFQVANALIRNALYSKEKCILRRLAQSTVKRNANFIVTASLALILSKQLKGKYELLLPAQICFFFCEI